MKKLLMLMLLCVFNLAFASSEKIKLIDEKLYYPQLVGLNDFVVEIELKGLVDKLREQKIFGKIKEVKFKLYWSSGRAYVAVEGLGKGFEEAKKQFAGGVEGLISWIIPMTWEDQYKQYQIVEKDYGFKAKDLTGKNEILEYEIKVDKTTDLIQTIEGKNGVASFLKNFKYENISMPKKRSVFSEVMTQFSKNQFQYKNEVKIKRTLVSGHYLPSKIEIFNYVVGPQNKSMDKKDEFIFSEYKINTGEATKYILKGEVK